VFINAYGYHVLSQTDFLPYMLGGKYNADWSKIHSDYPFLTKGANLKQLRYYYLITLGYHFNSTRAVFWSYYNGKNKNDWIEMLLHHMITVVLYMFSYMLCLTKLGSLVMFLHDWADIWTPLTKMFVETTYKTPAIIGAALLWISWVYSRLIVLPFLYYYGIQVVPKSEIYPNWQVPGHVD